MSKTYSADEFNKTFYMRSFSGGVGGGKIDTSLMSHIPFDFLRASRNACLDIVYRDGRKVPADIQLICRDMSIVPNREYKATGPVEFAGNSEYPCYIFSGLAPC